MKKNIKDKLDFLINKLKDNKISFEQIEKTFSKELDDSLVLEDVLVYLEDLGIEVVETNISYDASGEVSDVIKEYSKFMSKYPLLTKEEEFYYGVLKDNGDKAAKEMLFNSNWRLVLSLITGKKRTHMSCEDLLQEGNIGLMKAIDKFDPYKGYRFTTYAIWWIRQAISRSIQNKERSIRLPVYLNEKLDKIKHVNLDLSDKLFREPTTKELAAELDISEKKLLKILSCSSNIESLDKNIKDDDSKGFSPLVSFIANPYENIELELENKEKVLMVNEMLLEIFLKDLDISLTEEELYYCFELYRIFDIKSKELLRESNKLKIMTVENSDLYKRVKSEITKKIDSLEDGDEKDKYSKLLNNLSQAFINKQTDDLLKEMIDVNTDCDFNEKQLFKDLNTIDNYYNAKINDLVFSDKEINDMYITLPLGFPDFISEKDTYKKIYDGLKYVDILKRRNGFIDDTIFLHSDIALMYNVSRERIRQIGNKGLNIARKSLMSPYYQNKYRGHIPTVNKILSYNKK